MPVSHHPHACLFSLQKLHFFRMGVILADRCGSKTSHCRRIQTFHHDPNLLCRPACISINDIRHIAAPRCCSTVLIHRDSPPSTITSASTNLGRSQSRGRGRLHQQRGAVLLPLPKPERQRQPQPRGSGYGRLDVYGPHRAAPHLPRAVRGAEPCLWCMISQTPHRPPACSVQTQTLSTQSSLGPRPQASQRPPQLRPPVSSSRQPAISLFLCHPLPAHPL